VGLLVEEHRTEIAAMWRSALERELGGEPAIGFAVGPLLREMALALRGDGPSALQRLAGAASDAETGLSRCAVLVRSAAQPGRVAREFKLLHRAVWEILRGAGRIVGADERRAADEWLDEALAASLDRLERVRARVDLLERSPATAPATSVRPLSARSATPVLRPPPLPRTRPPPIPAAAASGD
jgi:hypothetical protein